VNNRFGRRLFATGAIYGLLLAGFAFLTATRGLKASPPWFHWRHYPACDVPCSPGVDCGGPDEWAGTWYWLRSPEEEKRVISSYFNRYCIRCHGVDGRGVWDIPGVPNFANPRWQASRTDAQLARIILEGRGAVMPPFRGTLTLEEACAMARYLRTFVPGTETARPDLETTDKSGNKPQVPSSKMPEAPPD
jgi:mono/diheme cytochrome c family protein